MNSNSITAFDAAVSQSIVAKDLKSGATAFRPMTRKSFALTKDGAGLKGQALKRAHKDYLDKVASEAGGEVAKAIAEGKLKVVGWNVNAKQTAGSVKFETAEHFARHGAKGEARAPKMTEEKALEFLAKAQGVSVDDLKTALSLAAAK